MRLRQRGRINRAIIASREMSDSVLVYNEGPVFPFTLFIFVFSKDPILFLRHHRSGNAGRVTIQSPCIRVTCH